MAEEESETAMSKWQTPGGRQIIGLALLLCVICLWTGSSFITNAMFTDLEYNKPFLTTYLCTATFALYLVKPGWAYLRNRSRGSRTSIFVKDEGDRYGEYAPLSRSASIEAPPVEVALEQCAVETLPPLTIKQTSTVALMFSTIWFAANVTINMALAQTSVSSVTILSSLSGLFTLVLGSIFGIERFNSIRLMAVAASIVGVILVSKADDGIIPADTKGRIANDPRIPKHAIMGDLLAILSALFYAMYTLLLKAKTGDETRISMTLFFGFVGAWNILLFWPILLVLDVTGLEPLEWPRSTELVIFLAINAMITFVSDITMMLSMLMTSPLAVTLGLSLTIPLAVIGDLARGTQIGGLALWFGAVLVLAGFVAVGWADYKEQAPETDPPVLGRRSRSASLDLSG